MHHSLGIGDVIEWLLEDSSWEDNLIERGTIVSIDCLRKHGPFSSICGILPLLQISPHKELLSQQAVVHLICVLYFQLKNRRNTRSQQVNQDDNK